MEIRHLPGCSPLFVMLRNKGAISFPVSFARHLSAAFLSPSPTRRSLDQLMTRIFNSSELAEKGGADEGTKGTWDQLTANGNDVCISV